MDSDSKRYCMHMPHVVLTITIRSLRYCIAIFKVDDCKCKQKGSKALKLIFLLHLYNRLTIVDCHIKMQFYYMH